MDTNLKITLLVVSIFLLLLSSFFSAAETAYTSISKLKYEKDAEKGLWSAKLIEKHHKNFGWTLTTILLANNFVNVAMSTLTTVLFASVISDDTIATIVTTVVVTPIIVIAGEVFPKLFAKKSAYAYLKFVAITIEVLSWITWPFTYPLSKFYTASAITNTEKDIQSILNLARKERVLEKKEAAIASNALKLDSIKVKEVYRPKAEVSVVSTDFKVKKVLDVFADNGHSRMPVTDKRGKYIGVVYLKDIIKQKQGTAGDYVKRVPMISHNTILSNALEKLRFERAHFAFVTTSANSKVAIGILTVEDIIEELVGEIYDEHDTVGKVREIGLYKFVASGSVPIETINEKLGYIIDDKDIDTSSLKIWINKRINRSLRKGLIYTYKDLLRFKVISNKNKEDTFFEIMIK